MLSITIPSMDKKPKRKRRVRVETADGEVLMRHEHKTFADAYLTNFNATQAYLLIHPNITYNAARVAASRLLSTDNVSAYVQMKLAEVQMSADEALKLLSEQARADLGDLITVDEEGITRINFDEAKRKGITHTIRKFKSVVRTRRFDNMEADEVTQQVEVELYDAQAAIEKILRVHGKFKDNVDITSGGQPIKGYIGFSPGEWDKEKEKEEQ